MNTSTRVPLNQTDCTDWRDIYPWRDIQAIKTHFTHEEKASSWVCLDILQINKHFHMKRRLTHKDTFAHECKSNPWRCILPMKRQLTHEGTFYPWRDILPKKNISPMRRSELDYTFYPGRVILQIKRYLPVKGHLTHKNTFSLWSDTWPTKRHLTQERIFHPRRTFHPWQDVLPMTRHFTQEETFNSRSNILLLR